MIRFSRAFAIFSIFVSIVFVVSGFMMNTVFKIEISHTTNTLLYIATTGVLCQFIHALAILLTIALSPWLNPIWQKSSLHLFILGTILCSGSIYAIAIFNSFVSIPPLIAGGIFLLTGWVCLIIGVLRRKVSGKP